MIEKTYKNAFGDDLFVEEFTRKEFKEAAIDFIDNAKWCEECDIPMEDTIYIQYKDGSRFSYYDAFGFEGKFKRTNIVFGIISNSCTQQVFGDYTVNGQGIVEFEEE